jgi:hypothetical protein
MCIRSVSVRGVIARLSRLEIRYLYMLEEGQVTTLVSYSIKLSLLSSRKWLCHINKFADVIWHLMLMALVWHFHWDWSKHNLPVAGTVHASLINPKQL